MMSIRLEPRQKFVFGPFISPADGERGKAYSARERNPGAARETPRPSSMGAGERKSRAKKKIQDREIPGPREKKARAARESPRSGEKPHGRERNPGLCYIGPERKSKVVRKNP